MKLAYTIFYSRDPVAAASFYNDLLGVQTLDIAPDFVSLSLSNCILGIKLSSEPREVPGAQTIIFEVDDIDGEYERLKDKAAIATPLNAAAWGKNFALSDPDGNKIEFVAAGS